MDSLSKRKVIFILWAFFGIAIFVAIWFYYLQQQDVLVRGVPYYGTFTGTAIRTPVQSVAAMILRYWGDERLTIEEIVFEKLFHGRTELDEPRTSALQELASFFREQGYSAQIESFNDISDFKTKLAASIPLVLTIKLPVKNYNLTEFAVLLGVLPSKQVLVVHSNFLGNNYEMPFKFFQDSLVDKPVYLAMEPTPEIKSLIRGPKPNQPYLPRLGIMDDPELIRLMAKWKYTIELPPVLDTTRLWEEIVGDPSFIKLRPTGQIAAYLYLAMEYSEKSEYDKAIQTIRERALLLNHDVEKAYGEWPAFQGWDANMEWGVPWDVLGDVYWKKGDRTAAVAAYERAIQVDRSYAPELRKKVQRLQTGVR